MAKQFKIHDESTAPEESREMLAATKADFGMIPNLEAVMASAPTLLASYVSSWANFQKSSLSEVEQQVVYMTVNFENNCEYCVPWHTYLSKMAKMPEREIENLRAGRPLEDPKLRALQQFCKTMVRTNGSIAPADLTELLDEGYTQQHALEVVLGVAIKVMSNYTNALAQTPLDGAVKKFRWAKPNLRGKPDRTP